MAKKITQSDISDEDVYGLITASAKLLNEELKKFNTKINSQAEAVKKLNTANTAGQKSIDSQIVSRKAMNDLQKQAEVEDKKALSSAKALEKVRLDEIRVQQNREKAVDKFNKAQERATKQAEKEVKALEKVRLDEIRVQQNREKAVDKFNKAQERATKQAEKEVKVLADSKNAYKNLTKEVNHAQAEFKRLAAEFGVTDKRAVNARKTFEVLDDKLRKVNNAARDGRRDVGRYGLALEGVKGSARRMVGGLAAGFGALSLIRSGFGLINDFESSIASLGAITGLTGKGLEDLKSKVLDVSNETGKSATEISEAMKLIGSAQPELLKSADALAAVTKQAVILSQAGGIDVPEAADALTKAMNQFGVGAEEAANFTDILATSQQKGTATISQLSEAIKNSGSVARASGLSFQTTNAALQALAKGGLTGAEAGTKLRGILLKLAKTGREDLNPATNNFTDILSTLKNEVTDVTKAAAMFGEENAAGALTLINQRKVVEELDGALLEHGNAQAQAATNMNTVAGATEQAKTAIQNYILGSKGATYVSTGLKNSLQFLTKNISTIGTVIGRAIIAYVAFKATMATLKLIEQISNFKKFGDAIEGSADSMTEAGSNAKKFGTALKGVGFAVAVTLALELGNALIKAANGTYLFRKQLEGFDKYQSKIDAKLERRLDQEKKSLNNKLKIIDANKKLSKSEKLLQKEEVVKKATSDITDEIKGLREREGWLQMGMKSFNEEYKKSQGNLPVKVEAARREQRRMIEALQGQIITLKAVRDGYRDTTTSLKEETGSLKEETEATLDNNKSKEEQVSLLRRIQDAEIELLFTEKSRALEAAKIDAARDIEDLASLNALESEKSELTLLIQEKLIKDIEEIEKEHRKTLMDAEIQHLQDTRDAKIELEKSFETDVQALTDEEIFKPERDKERLRLLQDEKKSMEEVEKEYTDFLIDELEFRIGLEKDGSAEKLELELELAELKRTQREKDAEHEKKTAEDVKKFLQDIGSDALKEAQRMSQEKQSLLDQEISASQKLEDQLRSKAENVNATAQESLKLQQDVTNEKMDEKKKEAKREQALKELGLLYDSIASFMSSGDSLPTATAKGLAGTLGVRKVAETLFNLAGFAKGGYTGDGGKNEVKGLVHGGEFVVDKETTSKLGLNNARMEDFAGIMNNNGSIQDAVLFHQLNGSGMMSGIGTESQKDANSIALISEIRNLTKVVKAKKEFEISDGAKNALGRGLEIIEREGSITNVYKTLLRSKK